MNDFLNAIPDMFAMSSMTIPELLFRVFLAMLFGFMVGVDRDRKNKPIDFRVYMIVALVSCIVAILGQEIQAQSIEADLAPMDLGRLIAGVLTGIGFLGAGTIIHRGGNTVVGTATGASIWASGGIGLCLGFGFYMLSAVAFLSVLITLICSGYFMKKMHDNKDLNDNPDF